MSQAFRRSVVSLLLPWLDYMRVLRRINYRRKFRNEHKQKYSARENLIFFVLLILSNTTTSDLLSVLSYYFKLPIIEKMRTL